MEFELAKEVARLLNLPPVVVVYLAWLGWMCFKRSRQLDIAFNKIRALENCNGKKPATIEDIVDRGDHGAGAACPACRVSSLAPLQPRCVF